LREAIAIRHVITIQVAPGKATDFASALRVVQAGAYQEEGCEQYELFQSSQRAICQSSVRSTIPA
jgi:quinol monooxygenase YgiN